MGGIMEQGQHPKGGKYPLNGPNKFLKMKFAMNRASNNLKYGFGTNIPLQMGVGTDMYNTLMKPKEKRIMELTEAITSPNGFIDLIKKAIENRNKTKEINNG